MKKYLNMTTLPCLVAVLGTVGAALRYLMFQTAVDEKGLLAPWNLPGGLVMALSVLTALLVAVVGWGLSGSDRYRENFPASIPGAVSACGLAVGILSLLMAPALRFDKLATIRLWLGWLSIPCLLMTAYGRLKGSRPAFFFHAVVCLFLGLHLADHYRDWSGEPQLAAYLFQLLSCAGLTLTAYQRTAFDVGLGNQRAYRIIGLLSAYFCFLAIVASDSPLFYLTGGIWCLVSFHAPAPIQEVEHE